MKVAKIFFLAFFPLFAFGAQELELNTLIGKKHKIFSVDRPRFITRKIAPYFCWNSDEKMEARYPGYQNSPRVTFFGHPVQECIFRFEENHLSAIYISVYNRGDAGEISRKALDAAVSTLSEQISQQLETSVPPINKERLVNKLYIWNRVWQQKEYTYVMKWSFSDRVAEYLQIEIRHTQDGDTSATATKIRNGSLKSNEELIKNIQRDTKGNVYIDNIPMVDQGKKGYCVVAVMERVLRYYGADINQHVFAQLANSSKDHGTSTEAIQEILKKTGGKLGVRINERFNLIANSHDLDRLCSKYNTTAKRAKKGRVQPVITRAGNQNVVDVGATLMRMDPEVLQTVRLSEKSGMRDFFSDIKSHTERGLPVVWSVLLGMVPEDKVVPQTRGAHMRLIIGYNASTKEVIYSDSWGMGHERKSMPLEDAWTITTLTLFLDPR